MWFLRRRPRTAEATPEVLPPAGGPMRRVEITVERHWISRVRSPEEMDANREPMPQAPRVLDDDKDSDKELL